MQTFSHALCRWLLFTACLLPFYGFLLYCFAPILCRIEWLRWTKPEQIPTNHPLIQISGAGLVKFTGQECHPLPKRFAIFNGWPFITFLISFNLFDKMEKIGLSIGWRISLMLGVQVIFILLTIPVFKRLQPRWINAHLKAYSPL